MDKAFLCHSSQDKDYVRVVARRLGRAKVVFDELSFAAGHDFRDEIVVKLASSSLFVFFVSRASLGSCWVGYELDEASWQKTHGDLQGQLAIIIDSTVTFADLPRWMQRFRALIQPRPVQAAREIERELLALAPGLAERPFVGRQELQRAFVSQLAVPMDVAPHVFWVVGLEGIGRRSYLSRILQDNLGLTLGPYRVVDAASTLEDLYVWLVDETGTVETRLQLAEQSAAFRSLAEPDQLREVGVQFDALCATRFVPCLIDRGGLLGEDGQVRAPYQDLVRFFVAAEEDRYLALVGTRAAQDGGPAEDRQALQRIGPLRTPEARLLLQLLLRRAEVAISEEALAELTEYLGGYPPAAYFVARQIGTYGVDLTVADKSLLVDFRAKRFTRFLADLRLSELEWAVLRYLASEESIPLAAVAVGLDLDLSLTAAALRALIDNSLVLLADDNFSVSPPIRDAVLRVRGHLTEDEYDHIAARLTQAFWSQETAAPAVEVVDATLHAVARSGSGSLEPYRDLVRVSVVHRLARECYHRREWEQARAYAETAQEMGASGADIREIHFKALVRLERWDDAARSLQIITQRGDRDTLFLKGFMHRRRREFDQALAAYEAAIRTRPPSASLRREYADCLSRVGRYKEAAEQIGLVLQRQSENIFALDLALRIYLDGARQGIGVGIDRDKAQEYLEDLERFDVDRRFIHHRRATFLAHLRRWPEALVEATEACNSPWPAFETHALKCDILIEMGEYEAANRELANLGHRFPVEADVQRGLAVKLLTRQGNWQAALAAWEELRDRERPVHRALLKGIKEIQGQDLTLSLGSRLAAQREVSELQAALDASIAPEGSVLMEEDRYEM